MAPRAGRHRARINAAPRPVQGIPIDSRRPRRVLQNAGAPGERADKKQSDRARKDKSVQRSKQGKLAKPECQHVEEAACRIDARSIRHMLSDRGRGGKQSRWWKRLHRKIENKKYQRGDGQQPARTEQEWQHDQAGKRIFGENITVPDQAKVKPAEYQQHGKPPHEQRGAALAVRKPLELDRKARTEQQRKQRKRLHLDDQCQDCFDSAVDRRCRARVGKKLFKDRNAEFQ